jgi:hypothetical protein
MASEFVASWFQLSTEVGEIVNLTIESDHVPPASGVHWLMSFAGQVQNGKPAMSEGDARLCVNPGTAIVGAAVNKLVRHGCGYTSQRFIVTATNL